MLPVAAGMWCAASSAARVFSGGDALVATAAASYLHTVALVFPLMAVEAVYEGALTGLQRTGAVLAVGLVLNLGRIPLALFLAARWGVDGVWAAIAISTALKAPAKWWCFRRTRDNKDVAVAI